LAGNRKPGDDGAGTTLGNPSPASASGAAWQRKTEAMKTLIVCLLGLPLALSGCMTTEQRAELRAQNAAADDSECRSYGAEKGSDLYFQCRMIKGERHEQAEAAAESERQRRISCGLRGIAASFGTAEQQHDGMMALAASGC
jgi:hypothetical protein